MEWKLSLQGKFNNQTRVLLLVTLADEGTMAHPHFVIVQVYGLRFEVWLSNPYVIVVAEVITKTLYFYWANLGVKRKSSKTHWTAKSDHLDHAVLHLTIPIHGQAGRWLHQGNRVFLFSMTEVGVRGPEVIDG